MFPERLVNANLPLLSVELGDFHTYLGFQEQAAEDHFADGPSTKHIESVSACRRVFIRTRSCCLFHVTSPVLARRAYLSFVIACTRDVQRHRARVAER